MRIGKCPLEDEKFLFGLTPILCTPRNTHLLADPQVWGDEKFSLHGTWTFVVKLVRGFRC